MKKLYQRLQQILGFSQRETNGFLILSALMLLFILGMFWIPALIPSEKYDRTKDQKLLDSLVSQLDTTSFDSTFASTPRKYDPPILQILFPFDPNQISVYQWQQLGTPKFIAERIIRFRGKGGRFRTKSDVKKIYDFPDTLYQQLYSYIQLPENTSNPNSIVQKDKTPYGTKSFDKPNRESAAPTRFNLNTADTNQLKAIRGIGTGLSRRIINYRDALGGFANINQVREVYGLDSTVVEELLKYAYLPENQLIQRLKINSATVEELDAHPYITPRLAKIIVAYRQQHGPYHSISDLTNIKILDQTTLQKIAPYLSFE